jgi:F-type H+-transporting ATPase subunit epsilon
MAETVQFDLVSPERQLVSKAVEQVQIHGTDGDMTVMASQAPLITTLRPGLVRVTDRDGESDYVVTGGFAEISGESISVLAEQAVTRQDMTQEQMKAMVDEATERLNAAKENHENEPGPVDEATKLLSDMMAVGERIGLSAY